MRAARVVLDIGVHLEKPRLDGEGTWDADYALDFMRRNVNMPDEFVQFEVNRYLGWPGQAPVLQGRAAHLGADPRRRRRPRRATAFAIKAFHKRALDIGGVGLDTLRVGARELTTGSLLDGEVARQQARDLLVGRLREVGVELARPPRSRGSDADRRTRRRSPSPGASSAGATGTARTIRAAPCARRAWHAAIAVAPVATPSSTTIAVATGDRTASDAANSRSRRSSSTRSRSSTKRELLRRDAAVRTASGLHDLARRPRSRRPRTPRARARRACEPQRRRAAGRGARATSAATTTPPRGMPNTTASRTASRRPAAAASSRPASARSAKMVTRTRYACGIRRGGECARPIGCSYACA